MSTRPTARTQLRGTWCEIEVRRHDADVDGPYTYLEATTRADGLPMADIWADGHLGQAGLLRLAGALSAERTPEGVIVEWAAGRQVAA